MNGTAASTHLETAATALPSRSKALWRWPTVIFAAMPATVLAFPAALAILLGGAASLSFKPAALALLLCGVCGWAGMLALWSAARTPWADVVSRRTAWGLTAGIVSVLIYYGFELTADDLDDRLWRFTPLLTIGPLLFALSYLNRYRQRPQPRAGDRPAVTIQDPEITPPGVSPPFAATPPLASASDAAPWPVNEGRMRRIMAVLWIVPLILVLIIVPPHLDHRASLGTLMILTAAFPFYLGIAVTSVWCFSRTRSRVLRGLAAAALLTPIVLPFVLRALAKGFGQEVIEKAATVGAMAIPLLLLLLLPKGVAGYLPSFVLQSRILAWVWTAVLTLALIPWVILVIWFYSLEKPETPEPIAFLIVHTVTSIAIAVPTLVTAYLALRSQAPKHEHPPGQWRQTRLRIAHLVLSILLLIAAIPAVVGIWFVFSLAGLG